MKNEPYEGTHVQPAVTAERLKQEQQALAKAKRAAAREERRRLKAARSPKEPRKPKEPKPLPPPRPVNRKRRRLFLGAAVAAALLLALLAFVVTDRSGAAARKQYMLQAAASYEAGDYDAALSSLRRAEAIASDEDCLQMMADCYEAQGNLEKTLEVLRRMNRAEQSVTQRITRLEQQRQQEAQAGYLTVAGRQLPPDTRDLMLDGLGLGDESLLEIAQLHALSSLSMMDDALTDLTPLAELGGLDTLNLSGNQIRDLTPLARLSQLRTLYLDDNPLTDLTPLYALHQLSTLSLCGIELDAQQLHALAAALPDCVIRSDAASPKVTEITLGAVSFKSDVTELDLSGQQLHDLQALALCTQLRSLDLSNNQISDLTPLMNLPNLETVDLRDNQVSDLRPLMGLRQLRSLDAANNRVTDTAAVGAMTGLRSLDLSHNSLTNLSGLRKLSKLSSLSLDSTGLYDGSLGDLEGLSQLRTLFLDNNPGLSNEAMGRLQSALPTCSISYTELVYTVTIGGVEQPSDATSLNLSGRELTDITPLDQMRCLETVDLSVNSIRNVYIFQHSPSRDTIRTLNLSDNGLTDITGLSALTAVESLDLRLNLISSVQPLMKLKTLRLLYLGGNPLSQQQLQALQEALPDCSINLD